MDPATLYVLFTLADGQRHTWSAEYATKAQCEDARQTTLTGQAKRPGKTVTWSYCWVHGTHPTEWMGEKIIYGVPLDPKHYR